ncbi:MAG TPA: DUF4091 domain-containing protein, partial [Armatimonadetes bacterium]|nr:DUF4091 domain-containing protein [Armatimonadota bacterium]
RIFKKHGVSPDSDEGKQLFERYAQAFVEHRLEPPIPSWLYPKVNSDGSISTETTHDALKAYMERMHRVSFLIRRPPFKDPFGADREKALRYLREMYAYLKANNWHRHAYLYVVDEPNTKDAYELVRKWGKLIHDAHPDLKLLCTEQPTPQKPEWGTLIGAVDIWCPLWALIDEDALKERLEAGDELWSYTALCQGAKPTPWWQLDFPLLNYRIPLWQSWMSGMTGILYWSTVFWTRVKDPWTQPQTYGSERTPFNCEGLLFYPGVDAGIAGPVTSMRLKALRDGMEDYEYFVLLSQVVGKEAVSQLVKSIAPSWFKWETDPKRLLKAREQVAEMLIQNIR